MILIRTQILMKFGSEPELMTARIAKRRLGNASLAHDVSYETERCYPAIFLVGTGKIPRI